MYNPPGIHAIEILKVIVAAFLVNSFDNEKKLLELSND